MPGSASQDDRRISLEGELTDEIKIDTSLIPEHVRICERPRLRSRCAAGCICQ